MRRSYRCPRVKPFVLTGSLDKDPWLGIPWTEDFVDILGESAPVPRFRTRAKMAWSDEGLLIAAELEEPYVWASLTERDSVIFHDNDFEVFLDPDGDRQNYIEIEVNALNTVWDLLLPRAYCDGGPALDSFDIKGFESRVEVRGSLNDPTDTDEGWSVEMLLPWRSLREAAPASCPPRPGDCWRINFSRVEWQHEVVNGRSRRVPETPEDNWVWSPQGVVDMHRPEMWGVLEFCESLSDPPFEDRSWDGLDEVMEVYWAQKERISSSACAAESLKELGLERLEGRVRTAAAETWFCAECEGWRIDASGRLSSPVRPPRS